MILKEGVVGVVFEISLWIMLAIFFLLFYEKEVIFAKGERIREHGLRLVLRFALQILRLRGLPWKRKTPEKKQSLYLKKTRRRFE